ncbi:MAG: sulfotransferase domain-containing protein [Bacteroidales bacterium]|nr:sulfotransferase domain-containing protein [Bacteroidales bacterium]MCF8332521.1 sulfotransferase domain-containing protein [Bacteroidales bacterium]
MKTHPEIIFHVGLEKTGTTFLQRSVFPNFKDVHYVIKRNYRYIDDIVARHPNKKVLLSHEFGRHDFYPKIKKFAQKYPHAKTIIVFRHHDEWIASYYRFLIKRGLKENFNEFFDIENDKGTWKIEDLYYYPEIKFLESHFSQKPLVLFHNDLKNEPKKFIQQIANYAGIKDMGPISYKPRHKSYRDKELKFRLWVTQNTIFKEIHRPGHTKRGKMRRLYNRLIRYATLYIAKLLPKAWINHKSLVPQDQLKKIREHYYNDWQKCVQYAQENNPPLY